MMGAKKRLSNTVHTLSYDLFQVTFGLKHFSDVITKRKLEMLPDNGTIVFESIANIHKGKLIMRFLSGRHLYASLFVATPKCGIVSYLFAERVCVQ